jgi:hypothetical protein
MRGLFDRRHDDILRTSRERVEETRKLVRAVELESSTVQADLAETREHLARMRRQMRDEPSSGFECTIENELLSEARKLLYGN